MVNEYAITTAVTFIFFVAVVGWGGLLCRLFPVTGTFWQELAARVVSGCVVMYAMFISLAYGGHLHRTDVTVVGAIGILLSSAEIPRLNLSAGAAFSKLKTWSRTDRLLGLVIVMYAFVHMLAGLTPLVLNDVQIPHFLASAQFLESGSLTHIPWNVDTNTPLTMQFIVGMSQAVDPSGQAAKWIFTLFGCLAAAGIFEFLRPAGLREALLGTACVLCFPEFLLMQTLGSIDLAIAGMMIVGAIWARKAFSEGSFRYALLAGFAFGLAAGSRYQAIVHVSWIVLVLLIEAKWTKSLRLMPATRDVAVIVCLIAMMLAPWLVRNYTHLGNPFFPLTPDNALAEWSPAQAEIWGVASFGPPFTALSPVQQALAPVGALLLFPANGLFGTATILGALIGIAVGRPPIRIAGLIGLGGLVLWGLLHPGGDSAILRDNTLGLMLLLAATGATLAGEWIPQRAGLAITLVLSTGSLIIAILNIQSVSPAAQSLIDPAARQAIHRTGLPSWQAMDFINERFDPHRDKVLLIGETKAFWLNVPYIAPSVYNGRQLERIFGGDAEPEEWTRELSRLGLTLLLVSHSEIDRCHRQYGYLNLSPAQMEKLNRWLEGLPKYFDDKRGDVVLGLPPGSAERRTELNSRS